MDVQYVHYIVLQGIQHAVQYETIWQQDTTWPFQHSQGEVNPASGCCDTSSAFTAHRLEFNAPRVVNQLPPFPKELIHTGQHATTSFGGLPFSVLRSVIQPSGSASRARIPKV